MNTAPLSCLIRQMAAAGAPPEAIAIAIEAIEAREGLLAEQRANARDRKRRQRSRDGHGTVTGQERDEDVTGHAPPPLDKKAPPNPLKEIIPPPPTDEAGASSVPPAGVEPGKVKPVRRRKQRKPGARLAAAWEPPAMDALPLETQALVHQWPAGAYAVTAVQFRNHWLAEGRAVGAKRDWPRTWYNWLLRESPSILRAAKAGVDYATIARVGAPGSGGTVGAAQLAEMAASFRRIGRTEEADEYDRLAEAARERAPDTS